MSVDLTDPMGSEGLLAPERADPPDVTQEQPDPARRRALVAARTALGGIDVAITAVPFVGSMLPSERAKAAGAPVEADISQLEPGNVPAPTNLVIPQHGYLSDSSLLIGTEVKQ